MILCSTPSLTMLSMDTRHLAHRFAFDQLGPGQFVKTAGNEWD